jgi:tetratricopeptide (TPR) repeat protein
MEPGPDPSPLPVPKVGSFRLIRRIGAGSGGAVYLAKDESLGRTVAVKILGADPTGERQKAERFAREARAVASLRHRNIVTIHAAGEETGLRFLAMEYVPGAGLDEVIEERNARGTLPAARDVARWGRDVAAALQCAHEHGIVHRDVKPSNIRIADDGRAVLLDFGIAREDDSATLTTTGEFRGSPQYASPEQVGRAGASPDARSDVYSLGVTLYELLTGAAPFRAATRDQLFHQILQREPVALRRLEPSVPRDLETLVLAMLEKDPARRPRTARAVAADLEAILDGRPIATRPVSLIGRCARWAKRKPAKATLAACLTLGIPLIAALGGYIAANAPKIARGAAAERAANLARVLETGFLEYGEGDPAVAVAVFQEALRLDPSSAEAKAGFVLASTDRDREGAQAAIVFLDADARDGDSPEWRAQLRARAQARLGDSVPETRARSAETAIDWFVRGILSLQRAHRGDPKAAAAAYDALTKAMLLRPAPSALYHYELGHAAWHAGRHKEARAIADAIRSRWPGTPETHFAVGRTLADADPKTSVAAFVEAAREPPRAASAATLIVSRLTDSRQPDLQGIAVNLARETKARHPENAGIRIALSYLLQVQGRLDEAVAEAREAVQRDPKGAAPRRRLAEALVGTKDYAAVIEPARAATALTPNDAKAWNVLGIALLHRNELDEAINSFETSLGLEPGNASTLCNLGRALQRRGDLDGALARLEEGDRIGSKDPGWKYPSKAWLAEVRRKIALRQDIEGESRPATRSVSR